MKVIITESQYNKAVDTYISFLFDPHEVKTHKEYPNSIFWVKDGEVIVQIRKSNFCFLNYEIWKDISRMFELDDDGIKSVVRMWFKKHHNLEQLKFKKAMFSLSL